MDMRTLFLLVPLALAGCDGDGGGGGNVFLEIFNQDPNDTPVEIDDEDSLRADIQDLFSGPNDDPKEPDDVL